MVCPVFDVYGYLCRDPFCEVCAEFFACPREDHQHICV